MSSLQMFVGESPVFPSFLPLVPSAVGGGGGGGVRNLRIFDRVSGLVCYENRKLFVLQQLCLGQIDRCLFAQINQRRWFLQLSQTAITSIVEIYKCI